MFSIASWFSRGELLCHVLYPSEAWQQVVITAFSYYRKEQSCILINLMKEYQSLKSTVMKVIDSANSASVTKSIWKDHEDVRRTLSKVMTSIFLRGILTIFLIEFTFF